MASSNPTPATMTLTDDNASSVTSSAPPMPPTTSAASATSVEPLRERQYNPQRSIEAFNDASRRAFNAYIARGDEPRRHFNDEQYDEFAEWCTGRIPRSEAQRSHMRSIERSYVFFRDEQAGKQCLYRHPVKEHTWRKVLKKHEVFDAIVQAHLDTAHGGVEPTFKDVQARYYGVTRKDVKEALKLCRICVRRRHQHNARAPLRPLVVQDVFEKVQIDLID
ncbi:hypothetical protein B0J12DRAFT_746554 [Macrophomina phaseolina]|uniref:Integrase zinc-binding domain-containing protein n=1 Tax=Macrophomina phaseolina TaxID=35725 RepID=A0ABQ8FS95_9PEZI|nr:hypothetical protein B0J12DRAFT_746554 [Macrophomina phaseolina]